MEEALTTTEHTAIASSIIPWPYEDNRGKYLSYRACGLSVLEALHMLNLEHSELTKWREDFEFLNIETRIPELRKELAMDYTSIEFVRNFRLALAKDYDVLQKALHPKKIKTKIMLPDGRVTEDEVEVDIPMSEQDHEYLKIARRAYDPQKLTLLRQLVTGQSDSFNFAQAVASLSKGKSVKITQMEVKDAS